MPTTSFCQNYEFIWVSKHHCRKEWNVDVTKVFYWFTKMFKSQKDTDGKAALADGSRSRHRDVCDVGDVQVNFYHNSYSLAFKAKGNTKTTTSTLRNKPAVIKKDLDLPLDVFWSRSTPCQHLGHPQQQMALLLSLLSQQCRICLGVHCS